MQRDKPKTAIAEMLKQVKNASVTHDGSEVNILKKNLTSPDAYEPYSTIATQTSSNTIIKINPNDCILWEFKDRLESDLGNIDLLAEDIKLNGQTQPGIVRSLKNNKNEKKYEIIVGERRWRACQKIGTTFSAIIQNISDPEAAIIQASENLQRKDLSEYAKGMNYAKLIDKGVISQSELQKKLNLSKATMSALLSFAAIPPQIAEAIGDFSKVSAHVASLIRAFSNKGQENITALITIAPSIRSGIGSEHFKKLINQVLFPSNLEEKETILVKDDNGKSLFSLKIKKGQMVEVNLFIQIKDIKKLENNLLVFIQNELGNLNPVRSTEQDLELTA